MSTDRNHDIEKFAALFKRAREKKNDQGMTAATHAAGSHARALANAEEARLLAVFADIV